MKSIKVKVLAFAAASILVASCAKEKDGYDKNLTKSAWKVTSGSIVNETVEKHDYTDGNDNTTNTSRITQTLTSSTFVQEEYELDTKVGDPDFFQKQVDNYDMTVAVTFGEDGVSKTDITQALKSVTVSSTGNPEQTTTYTSLPATSSNSGYWSWSNNTDQKAYLTFGFGGIGSWVVESITKDELVLVMNTSSTEINKPSSAETETVTKTITAKITLNH